MPDLSPFVGYEHAVQEHVELAPLTWYALGGPARYLVRPKDPDELRALSRRCVENGVRVLVLGKGANLLVADEGVDAAVFKLDSDYFEEFAADGSTVSAGAGADMQVVARFCVRRGLSGLQCMAGIPGTIGGCVRGNAGGKYGDIGASISRVTVMSVEGEIFDRTRDDLLFTYRKSNIAATFVMGAKFDLQEDRPEELVRRFKEIWMFKKNTQPLNTKNAGCTFKNPQYAAGMPGPSAGVLIDQAGLKGYRIGLAEVSTKHANFIIAHPGCTATEIMRLIDHVQETVFKVHGIALEQEVVIWK